MRPRLLDLCCGAGGAAVGYAWAGFEVVGVDIAPHPDFPFELIVGDVCEVLADSSFLKGFAAVHASPPCQGYTTMSNRYRGRGGATDEHPKLIPAVRRGLVASGLPFVIENVPGARAELRDPITLRGGHFWLGVDRPRLFETNFPVTVPPHTRVPNPLGVYGARPDGRTLWRRADGTVQRAPRSLLEAQAAMGGLHWMTTWDDVREAIPPQYTEHLGRQLVAHLAQAA